MKVSTRRDMNIKDSNLCKEPLEIIRLVVGSELDEVVKHVFVQVRELISSANLSEILWNSNQQVAQSMKGVEFRINEDRVEWFRRSSVFLDVADGKHSTHWGKLESY